MKILMLGWEFPPHNQGGLGTACQGLVKGLTAQGITITMILPHFQESTINGCMIVSPHLTVIPVDSSLQAYHTTETYLRSFDKSKKSLYGENLFSEVQRYASAIELLVQEMKERFDVIHAHDWLTFLAGIKAREILKIPLVIHVHATEFDRTGGLSVNQTVYEIEKTGMKVADKIIAVSKFTQQKIIDNYNIRKEKISVVHNAVELNHHDLMNERTQAKCQQNYLVLFLGRITLQKGPDYFLQAAKKILSYREDITFIFAGSGDMMPSLIDDVCASGLSDKILFTGFLRGKDVDRMFQKADVYVMPSVSEPFGISPLEAMRNNVPTIISKQSGVSEVISHCLKVDFWDIDEMANKIIALLEYPCLANCLAKNGTEEIFRFNWDVPAQKCLAVYQELGCVV